MPDTIETLFGIESQKFMCDTKEVPNIFKPGKIVGVRHYLAVETILKIVQKVEDSTVSLKIDEDFIKNNVFKGDIVIFQILHEDCEYLAKGIITDLDISSPNLVHIYIENIRKFKNKRKQRRYFVNLQAEVYMQHLNTNVYAVVKNISKYGISAIFKESISIGQILNIKILIPINNSIPLSIKVRVIRVSSLINYNEYGLEFVDINKESENILNKLISQLEQDESKFIKDELK